PTNTYTLSLHDALPIYRVHRIEQGPIPVLFQNPPAALDGVVLTVVRRIICQAYGQLRSLGKLHQAVHELGPPTLALRAIVQIDEDRKSTRLNSSHVKIS